MSSGVRKCCISGAESQQEWIHIDSGNLFSIHYPLPITHYPLPITHYPLPITHYLYHLLTFFSHATKSSQYKRACPDNQAYRNPFEAAGE
ncbi:hypothetical protein CR164_03695 [Prosthecochloris marina]|uniref:Uncharacterized protein n=1 Tax=Prosthecochloris marina TaxID=2017681 RepID=A0A317T863_9CHLB|nr:hypothetical protein CR164_03695 [Prosthecochloris marina]